MYNTNRSGTFNGNKGGAGEAWLQSTAGSDGLGCIRQNTPSLGTGIAPAARSVVGDASTKNCRVSRGGQASLGLFGCGPSITGRPIRAFQALAEDQARRLGFGLSAGLQRSIEQNRARREREWNAPKATPLMLAHAAAGDMREAFPHLLDDEAEELAHRSGGAGYVEVTLAMES